MFEVGQIGDGGGNGIWALLGLCVGLREIGGIVVVVVGIKEMRRGVVGRMMLVLVVIGRGLVVGGEERMRLRERHGGVCLGRQGVARHRRGRVRRRLRSVTHGQGVEL